MADKKINDLPLAAGINPLMQLETDIGGETANKITIEQVYSDILTDVDHIDFDTSYAGSFPEGRLAWNPSQQTASLGLPNGSAELGQEEATLVCNKTGVQLNDGFVGYINGVESACPTAALAEPDQYEKSRVVGVFTENIANDGVGRITRGGLVRDINTLSVSVGPVFLAAGGTLSSTMPVGENFVIQVGVVLVSNATTGLLLVNPIISNVTSEVTNTNGFSPVQRSNTTLAFVDGSRTLTLAPVSPPYYYYINGDSIKLSSSVSIVIADTEGLHVVYFDDTTGVLSSIANPNEGQIDLIIRTKCWVSYVYWDQTNQEHLYLADERHGISMAPDTHSYLHFTRGAQFLSGLQLGDIDADASGNLDTSAQFSVTSGFTTDEDLITVVDSIASTTGLPIYYLDGASLNLRQLSKPGFSVIDDITAGTGATGRIIYNQILGGVGSLVTVSNNDYMLIHIFEINDYTDGRKVISILGQDDYATLLQVRNAAPVEISSILGKIPFEEKVPLGTVIFQANDGYTNAVKARIRTTSDGEDYVNWTTSELAQGVPPSAHNNLTNLTYAVAGHGTGFTGFQRGTTLSASDPTINDDSLLGYVAGDLWMNTVSGVAYICSDPTATAAVWKDIDNSSGASGVTDDVTITSTGQTAFPGALSQIPNSDDVFFLYLNGILQTLGEDYTRSGQDLTWLDANGVDIQDSTSTQPSKLIAIYNYSAPGGDTIWNRVGETITSKSGSDTLDLETGSLKFTAGAEITEISDDSTTASISATKLVTENGAKTFAQDKWLTSAVDPFINVQQTNVTGDGSTYPIIFQGAQRDLGNDFNFTTGEYTCPKHGFYSTTISLRISGLTASMTDLELDIVKDDGSADPRPLIKLNPNNARVSDALIINAAHMEAFDATEKLYFTLKVSGGALAVNVDILSRSSIFYAGDYSTT